MIFLPFIVPDLVLLTVSAAGLLVYLPLEKRAQYGIPSFENVTLAEKQIATLDNEIKTLWYKQNHADNAVSEARKNASKYADLLETLQQHKNDHDKLKDGWFQSKGPLPKLEFTDPVTGVAGTMDGKNAEQIINTIAGLKWKNDRERLNLSDVREDLAQQRGSQSYERDNLIKRLPKLEKYAIERLICKMNQVGDHNLV